jgi:hypothetical protein
VASPRGSSRWSKSTIAHILTNRRYTGDMVWNEGSKAKYTELANGQLCQYGRRAKQFRRHSEEDFIITADAHEAMIDRDIFEKVQWRLVANRYQSNPSSRGRQRRRRERKKFTRTAAIARQRYRLSGLLICSHCGARMTGNTMSSGEARYRCSTRCNYGLGACHNNSIRESFLIERLLSFIEKHILNPDGLAELHERRRAEMERLKKEQPHQLEALRRQGAELTRKIDGLTGKLGTLAEFADAGMMHHYHESIGKWKAQREVVEMQIAELLRPPELVDLDETARHVSHYMGQLRELMEQGEPRRLRLLLAELVDRIELKFTTRQCAKRSRSKFESGVIYVRPQLKCVTSKTQGRL